MKASWRLSGAEIDSTALAGHAVELVLVEFDGPQIRSVWGPRGTRRLAVACDEDHAAVRWIEVELSEANWNALFEGQLALRDALMQAHVWVVDEVRTGEVVGAWEISAADLDPALLPEPGALLPAVVRQRFSPTVAIK